AVGLPRVRTFTTSSYGSVTASPCDTSIAVNTARLTAKATRMLRRIGRATAFLSFASKLLVPVGYMPAALGDGGPIRLCDSGLAGALLDASVHADAGALHDSLHGHPVAASDSLHGHAGAAR